MAKSGWSQPLAIDIRFNMNLLTGAMQAGYDASGIGKRSGKLRAALGSLANYKLMKRDVRITVNLPYARIQDTGGRIPERRPRRAKAMRWIDSTGEMIFAKRARGFTLPGYRYIEAGGREIMNRLNGGRGAIQIRWKYSKAERAAFNG